MTSWLDLGTVTPRLNEWEFFPVSSIGGDTFRFTFGNLQNYRFFKSYCLVRFYVPIPNAPFYSLTRRLYPQPESVVLEFSLPQRLKDDGWLLWEPEVKKVLYRRWRGNSLEPAYTLKLEDFSGV